MYQLADDFAVVGAPDNAVVFLESCTSTPATDSNLSLVRSAASMMRQALENDNIKPLSDFVGSALHLGHDLADVLAAAGQLVIDSLGDVSVSSLEKWMRRIANLQRAILPLDDFEAFSAEGFGNRAFAG